MEGRPRHGEIVAPRQHHVGFLNYLESLDMRFRQRNQWEILNPIRSIVDSFDKRWTSKRFAEIGLPTPEVLFVSEPEPDALREAMQSKELRRVFVKLSCGSSASCLAAYALGDSNDYLMTTVEVADDGWYNHLGVRRVDDRTKIDQILRFILCEGAHVEAALPKARLQEAGRKRKSYFDLRMLVVDSQPVFHVIRQNTHPITNLHLGGWRGDPEILASTIDPVIWDTMLADCARASAEFGAFHVGFDVMFAPSLKEHFFLEANAFGDLLPGLDHEGLSVYGWQIERLRRTAI